MQVSGCTVVVEGGTGISVPTGRMSFLSFNPETEKMQKDLESQSRTLQQIRECGDAYRREMGSGAEISDLEMARRLEGINEVQKIEVTARTEKPSSHTPREDCNDNVEQSFKKARTGTPHVETANDGDPLELVKPSKMSAASRFQFGPGKQNQRQRLNQNRNQNKQGKKKQRQKRKKKPFQGQNQIKKV